MKSVQSFGIRLAVICASILMILALGVGLASVVEYKPYGVPDERREEYDQILRDLAERDRLMREGERKQLAKVVVPETEFDLGFINPNTVEAEHEFTVTNVGEGNLVLKRAGSSCKCTVAKLEDPVIKPGESAKVTIVWNSGSDIDDYFSQTAVIRTNDPQRPKIEFTLSGKVVAEWSFSAPIQATEHKIVGQPCSGSTVLYSQLYDDIMVIETQTSSELVSVSIEPPSENDLLIRQAKSGVTVIATYTPDDQREQFNEVVRCKLLDPHSGKEQWVETTFAGNYRQPVGFYGPNINKFSGLDLGVVEIGSGKKWSFFARFLIDEKIEDPIISKIEPNGLIATIEPIKRLDNTFRVTLSVDPKASPSRFNANRQGYIEVSDGETREVSNWLPLHGHIIKN